MKVIQTRVTSQKTTHATVDDFSDVARDYPLTEDNHINEEVAMTKEGFVAILETSGILGYILETLKERYLLRYKSYGGAESVLEKWLVDNRGSFTPESLELLNDRVDVDVIANTILDTHINVDRIRAGELSRFYALPLIGESNYAKH